MGFLSKLIDIIYPPRCAICRKFLREDGSKGSTEYESFCRECISEFKPCASPLCPVCGRPFISDAREDHLCEDCLRKRPLFKAAASPFIYDGVIMNAIHQFKYGQKSFLAKSLGPVLAGFARRWISEQKDLLTMPVPLHPKRLRERGFNQSLLLAGHVAQRLNSRLDYLTLKRVRYTLSQTGLGREERRKNVRGAFQVEDSDPVRGRVILLIDDVTTTGNTLNECARVLMKAGSREVMCLTLARAVNW
ncbi:MAG TPA: ComF family protein [Desulfobacteraceae bacterium]|nr:ComF family protein [Desulfobacteraceae bacterium]HPJ68900.1 ComF family protein [Desulfobacteraceae bacterium]HPQ27720.1 ComF family protein [Desulfobacteraceae bacterium]